MPSTLRPTETEVAARTHEWVAAGLITVEQADSITAYEREAPASPAREPERLSLTAEVAAYLGTLLALMGGLVVVGQRWRDLAVGGRLAIAVAIALVGFAAGSWLTHLGDAGTRRLGSLLWVLGVAGAALAVGISLDEFGVDGPAISISVGIVVAAIGLDLWRNLERPLQLLTVFAGLGAVLGGVIEQFDVRPWAAGVVTLIAATSFFAVSAAGRVRPRLVALAASSVSAMLAAAMLGDLDRHLGPAAAAVTAAAIIVFALVDRSMPMLVIGVLGFLIAVQALLATTFTGVASSGAVTVVGLAIVIVIVVRARPPRRAS